MIILFANFSHYQIFRNISSFGLLNICNREDACLPVIRICQDSEAPTDAFLYIGIIAVALFILSLCSSIVLFFQGSYYNIFKWSNIFFCGSPIIHPMLLQDIMKNFYDCSHMYMYKTILTRANVDLYYQKNRIDACNMLCSTLIVTSYKR